jgi:ABC-type oligopeptide transport system substrate-binding subunit
MTCTYGWIGDFNDPETYFNQFTTGNSNNPGKWTSKEYDDLYAKSKATNDNNERLELFRQMEKILLVDQAAIAPYCYGDIRDSDGHMLRVFSTLCLDQLITNMLIQREDNNL